MKYLIKRFNEINQDKEQQLAVFISSILLTCHAYQATHNPISLNPAIRMVLTAAFLASTIIAGRKLWSVIFTVAGFSILYFNRFQNYTSFGIILVLIWRKPERQNILLPAYAMAVLVCLLLNERGVTHAVIHYANCTWMFIVMNKHRKQAITNEINLTPDETNIIEQLRNGREIKEIEGFSRNTIYKKLGEARTRNKCATNGELLALYHSTQSHEKKQNPTTKKENSSR